MGSILEMVVVIVAVAVALAWAGRAAWRSVRKQGVCSSCGSSGECPIAQDPEVLAEITQKGQLPHLDSCQPGTLTCQELAEALEKESGDKTPRTPAS
ncbi:MAG: FeoB-associated Cys-rich membrane protein [Candidatus Krumholzibacteriota bacterium]